MLFTLLLKNILILLKNYIILTNLITKKLINKNLFCVIILFFIQVYIFPNITYCDIGDIELENDSNNDEISKKIITTVLIVGIILIVIYFLSDDNSGFDFNNNESELNFDKPVIPREPYVDAHPRDFLVGVTYTTDPDFFNTKNK